MLRKLSVDFEFPQYESFEENNYFCPSPDYNYMNHKFMFDNSQCEELTPWVQQEIPENLIPKNKKKLYTPSEDQLIQELVEQYGRRWKQIALHFPGKNQRMIRNRYLKISGQQQKKSKKSKKDQIQLAELKSVPSQCETHSVQYLDSIKENSFTSDMYDELHQIRNLSEQMDNIQNLLIQTKEEILSYILQKIDLINIPANADKAFQAQMIKRYLQQLNL